MSDIDIAERLIKLQTSQDLSAGPLSYTTNVGFDFKFIGAYLTLSAADNANQTFTITANLGTNYENAFASHTFRNETDVAILPDGEAVMFSDGDELQIDVTNNGSPAVTAYLTLILAER
jgi:hypothetical protein